MKAIHFHQIIARIWDSMFSDETTLRKLNPKPSWRQKAIKCAIAHTDWLDLGIASMLHSRASKVVASNACSTILKASSHGTPRDQILAAAKWMWWNFRLARYLSKCLLFISSLSNHTWFATWDSLGWSTELVWIVGHNCELQTHIPGWYKANMLKKNRTYDGYLWWNRSVSNIAKVQS